MSIHDAIRWKSKLVIVAVENCNDCVDLINQIPALDYIKLSDISVGLGDTIAKITSWFDIDECSSCKVRHLWANRLFPYFWRSTKDHRKIRRTMLKNKLVKYPVLMTQDFEKVYTPEQFFSVLDKIG